MSFTLSLIRAQINFPFKKAIDKDKSINNFRKKAFYILFAVTSPHSQDPIRRHSPLPWNLRVEKLLEREFAISEAFAIFHISSPLGFHVKFSQANWRFHTLNLCHIFNALLTLHPIFRYSYSCKTTHKEKYFEYIFTQVLMFLFPGSYFNINMKHACPKKQRE